MLQTPAHWQAASTGRGTTSIEAPHNLVHGVLGFPMADVYTGEIADHPGSKVLE